MKQATSLEADEVHIWCVNLARNASELVWMEGLLSPAELARADRLLNRQARERFVAGRVFLRETLAAYLGMTAKSLAIFEEEHGKPRLIGDDGGLEFLRFNLSHAGETALLAMASGREVGVDIEEMRADAPIEEMSRVAFSSREQEELFALASHLQRLAFYRCWTRKEAYLKGCGRGFSLPSNSFDVSLLPDHPPALLAHRSSPAEPSRWRLLDIAAPEGYCAALAIEGETAVVRYFSWDVWDE